jgi:hypothetical protein
LKSNEIIGGIVIFLFGVVTVLLSLRMPIGTFRSAGTGLFPLCLGIILMFLSGLFILQQFLKRRQAMEKKGSEVAASGSPNQLISFFGVMILITLFFNRLGFPLSSFLLMVALLRILGMKRWVFNLSISFITAIVCYFLFVQWLKIPLPKGWIGL